MSSLLHQGDDYLLLKEATLTLDQIEGVFTNPPPTIPRYDSIIVFPPTALRAIFAVVHSARNDLKCSFSSDGKEEILQNLGRLSIVTPGKEVKII